MAIEYQLTVEDYQHSMQAHHRPRRWIFILLLAGIATYVIAAPMMPAAGSASTPTPSAVGAGPGGNADLSQLSLSLLPWMLIFGVVWFMVFLLLRRQRIKPWERRAPTMLSRQRDRRMTWLLAILALLEICAVMALRMRYEMRASRAAGHSGSAAELSPAMTLLLDVIPWVLVALCIALYLGWRARGGNKNSTYSRLWNQQPMEHLPQMADWTPQGLSITSTHFRHEYRWECFQGFVETPELFMLYLTRLSFHMVPRRAFQSEGAQSEFREILRQKIAPALHAFPVLPAGQA